MLQRLLRPMIVVTLLAAPLSAHARGVHFVGGHPISSKGGGGFCYINVPHSHPYAPDKASLFQQVKGDYVFTGDPTPFGYDGEHHPYYGHHPIGTIAGEPVFCFLDGPHNHAFEVPDVPEYKVKKGVAFYMGPFPEPVARVRERRAKAINTEYRPYLAYRPTVTVDPPDGWPGQVWIAPPAVEVEAPGVQVNAPGVVVAQPSVTVSVPGVIVAPPSVVVTGPGVYVTGPGVYVEDRPMKLKHHKGKHLKVRGWH